MTRATSRGRTIHLLLLVAALVIIGMLSAQPAAALSVPGVTLLAHRANALTPAQFFIPFYSPPPEPRRPRRRYKRPRPRPRVTQPKCEHPWTYSHGLRRCICVAEGYGLSQGKCVKLAEICAQNGTWSQEQQRCVCNEGRVLRNGRCIDPEAETAALQPPPGAQCLWPKVPVEDGQSCECAPGYREEAGHCIRKGDDQDDARPDGLLTTEIALIQQCMKEAGYLRGEVTTRMTKRAWTAFWFFKQDYNVGSTPKGVHDARAQLKLFELCPLAARAVTGLRSDAVPAPPKPTEAEDRTADQTVAAATPPEKPGRAPAKPVYAKPEAGCLPDDLYDLIIKTYGKRSGLERCKTTCIPAPKGLSNRELLKLAQRPGISWCRSCLEIGAHLPLDDILKIERGAGVQLCVRPPTRLPKWQRADGRPRVAYTKVRELYRALPSATSRAGDIAVVIGNKNYQGGLPADESAHNNAGAIYALLTEHLGFAQENIIDLRDATYEDMVRVFGGDSDEPSGELAKRLAKAPDAALLIYFAGHGTMSLDGDEAYLLPVDAVEHREDRSAYPLSRLYANITRLETKSFMVLLEAGFSRDQSEFVFPPNLPELTAPVLPRVSLDGLTVMTATEYDQRTMDDPEYGIGLFTRYVIEGLAGHADLMPIGNGDGRIDAVELYAYTAHMVRLAARKSYGLLQNPSLSHKGNDPISTVQAPVR